LYIYKNRRFLNFDQNYQNDQNEISYFGNPVNSENSGSDNRENVRMLLLLVFGYCGYNWIDRQISGN